MNYKSIKPYQNMGLVKIYTFTVISILSFCLVGCEEERLSPNQSEETQVPFLFSAGVLEKADSEIFVIANSDIGAFASPTIRVYGTIRDGEDNLVDPEFISINGVDILDAGEAAAEGWGTGKFSNMYTNSELSSDWDKLNSSFGNTVPVVVSISDVVGGIEVNYELPEMLEVSIIQEGKELIGASAEINIKKPLTVKWSTLDENSVDAISNGHIAASIVYHAGLNYDPDLPSENVNVHDVQDRSVGSITFTPEQLAAFPVGGNATVYIGTAYQDVYSTNGASPSSISLSSITYEYSGNLQLVR